MEKKANAWTQTKITATISEQTNLPGLALTNYATLTVVDPSLELIFIHPIHFFSQLFLTCYDLAGSLFFDEQTSYTPRLELVTQSQTLDNDLP